MKRQSKSTLGEQNGKEITSQTNRWFIPNWSIRNKLHFEEKKELIWIWIFDNKYGLTHLRYFIWSFVIYIDRWFSGIVPKIPIIKWLFLRRIEMLKTNASAQLCHNLFNVWLFWIWKCPLMELCLYAPLVCRTSPLSQNVKIGRKACCVMKSQSESPFSVEVTKSFSNLLYSEVILFVQ